MEEKKRRHKDKLNDKGKIKRGNSKQGRSIK